MFEKVERIIKDIIEQMIELRRELYDLRSEVRTKEPIYATRWYNLKFVPTEDLKMMDFLYEEDL